MGYREVDACRQFAKSPFTDDTESYKHKLAKELLYGWLVETENNSNDDCHFANFGWRKNWGVYMEIPFYESSDVFYFEDSGGLTRTGEFGIMENYDRGKVLFIPDIVIFHKGTPLYVIEVVHMHPVTAEKFEIMDTFFHSRKTGAYLYVIQAETILVHTSIPEDLKPEVYWLGHGQV